MAEYHGLLDDPDYLPEDGRLERTVEVHNSSLLHRLIDCQAIDGHFEIVLNDFRHYILTHFNSGVEAAILDHLTSAQGFLQSCTYQDKAYRVFKTLLIVVFIEATYPDSAELWDLVVREAGRWLASELSDPRLLKTLKQLAKDNIRMQDLYPSGAVKKSEQMTGGDKCPPSVTTPAIKALDFSRAEVDTGRNIVDGGVLGQADLESTMGEDVEDRRKRQKVEEA